MPAPLRLVQDSIHFPDSVDVVIIGAGIAGAATCWELTQRLSGCRDRKGPGRGRAVKP